MWTLCGCVGAAVRRALRGRIVVSDRLRVLGSRADGQMRLQRSAGHTERHPGLHQKPLYNREPHRSNRTRVFPGAGQRDEFVSV